jgi:hypothetical protein
VLDDRITLATAVGTPSIELGETGRNLGLANRSMVVAAIADFDLMRARATHELLKRVGLELELHSLASACSITLNVALIASPLARSSLFRITIAVAAFNAMAAFS